MQRALRVFVDVCVVTVAGGLDSWPALWLLAVWSTRLLCGWCSVASTDVCEVVSWIPSWHVHTLSTTFTASQRHHDDTLHSSQQRHHCHYCTWSEAWSRPRDSISQWWWWWWWCESSHITPAAAAGGGLRGQWLSQHTSSTSTHDHCCRHVSNNTVTHASAHARAHAHTHTHTHTHMEPIITLSTLLHLIGSEWIDNVQSINISCVSSHTHTWHAINSTALSIRLCLNVGHVYSSKRKAVVRSSSVT